MMKFFLPFCFVLIFLVSCKQDQVTNAKDELDRLAIKYVKLALEIGQYDEAFVDAYYGPDSLKSTLPKSSVFPKDSLLNAAKALKEEAEKIASTDSSSTINHRAFWLSDQLSAFERRIRIHSGEYELFDKEAKELFGATAPVFAEQHYQRLVGELDDLLPGKGSIQDRFQSLANRFIIPKEKLDTVFKTAIAECRKRTLEHYTLPGGEDFKLEFVTGKSWSGYNWYKGNFQSLIQINMDLDIFIDRAIDVGSHESYPGHHVYNMLLEKNLFRNQGLTEISLYPLFSPQSLIAEGTANYGIELVFPGSEKAKYAREVLLPLAGLDTNGIALYFEALIIKGKLNYVRNDVGRGLLSGSMTEEEALQWLKEYGLYNDASAMKSIQFIRTYRTYVINYNYGLDLVRKYIEDRAGNDPSKRWEVFSKLLSNQVRINELIGEN